jgi:S-DNA-T family DNA segregation ATPase FtsK/SpoIIIE
MTVVDVVPYAAAAAGALGLFTRMCVWRRLPATPRPRPVAEILTQAPEILRPAVLHFVVPRFTWQMFTDLGLGSMQKGFPAVDWWDYDRHGMSLEAVPVGVCEDSGWWLLRVLYAHVLVAGATGSGKGSVLWSVIAGVGPAIQAGLVDVWMADPKGGAEFGRGEGRLFVRFTTTVDTILAMLREAVELMDERLVRMRAAGVRKLVPNTDEPLILIIIDEAASLSSYADRNEQEEFRRLTGLLLSKGRAAAVSLIAAVQDPSKETMPNRQLFPVRIGLRLDESTQTAMVHGHGARDRGARCDEIPDTTPGVGYVGEDGSTGFVRVRAFWVSDDQADAIVAAYAPAPEITAPAGDYSDFDPDDLGDEDFGAGDDGMGAAA